MILVPDLKHVLLKNFMMGFDQVTCIKTRKVLLSGCGQGLGEMVFYIVPFSGDIFIASNKGKGTLGGNCSCFSLGPERGKALGLGF